ncbi:Gfo/Idh/MocA family oxidoreductase [Bacillus sp. CECT 9360]|uniref:Gfo/Idh/MocA family protein n=1 Tax=Bacillus sp. CECT 9360 TaxID=2845821 RepID=UPI001E4B68EB|nr:Gfo/Idh/MocA family oxidoreductase [Bacillus sp. CECT 9360]CAH0344196.1 Glucose--fructose oxidoreductase [Bacillus sp. CECT 9360]
MTALRIGIIGVGGIAQTRHIPAFLELHDQCTITALSDVNIGRAKETAEKYKIPHVFENYHDLFSKVDAVCICTPNKFHAEISIAALEAGVHVLCEKPMAMNLAECEVMLSASIKADKVLAIAYHYRFMKEAQAAKKAMQEIGTPLVTRVQALRRRKVPGWGVFTNKELQGGGSLIDYGCHLLDLALWLTGNPKPISIHGSTYNRLSKTTNQINIWGDYDHDTFDVDDHVTAYIKFENGASMLFETSWAANIKDDQEHVSISGTDGGLSVFPFELYTVKNGMLLNSEAAWLPGNEDFGLSQAQNFVDACLGKAGLIVQPQEALQVSQIIEAIYENKS